MANLLNPNALYAGLFGPNAILTSTGAPVPNSPVTVYQSDGSTLATLYTDQSKATVGTNPVNTDAYGNLAFYTSPGEYILSFTVGGVGTTQTVEVLPWYTDAAMDAYTVTANASPGSGDAVLASAATAAVTISLPTPATGTHISVAKTDTTANTVTVTTAQGAILGPSLGTPASVSLVVPGQHLELVGDGTNYHVVGGGFLPSPVTFVLAPHTVAAGASFTTSTFAVPNAGLWLVSYNIECYWSAPGTGPQSFYIDLQHNGTSLSGARTRSEVTTTTTGTTGTTSLAQAVPVQCAAGDTFDLVYTNVTGSMGSVVFANNAPSLSNFFGASWLHP